MSNYIKHHGIKGMKWGVRRFQNKDGSLTPAGNKRYSDSERRAQMKKIAKRKNVKFDSDRKTAEYASKNIASRTADTVAKTAAIEVLKTAFTGGKLGPDTIKQIATNSAMNIAEQELRAMSVSKKYDKDGKVIKGVEKGKFISREDKISIGINAATKAASLASIAMKMKYASAEKNRQKNQEIFESWGGRILEQSFDSIVNLSSNEWRIKD